MVEFICDACGKREPVSFSESLLDVKPPGWWHTVSEEDGVQVACSLPCLYVLVEKTKKTSELA